MSEGRQYPRYDTASAIVGEFEVEREVSGRFRNTQPFIVKNVSIGGFNLLSNYAPAIGQNFQIYILYNQNKIDFEIKVVHSRIHEFLADEGNVLKSGVVYSNGCEIMQLNDEQRHLILEIIDNNCIKPDTAKQD